LGAGARAMKLLRSSFLVTIAALSACDSRTADPKPALPANQQNRSTPAPGGFLGLGDDQIRKIGDTSPDSALAAMTSITEVRLTTAAEYDRARAEGRIKAEETRNGYVYYAIEQTQHAPFPDGSSAYFTVTERFKAKLPDAK
jgi:hypothetical protein